MSTVTIANVMPLGGLRADNTKWVLEGRRNETVFFHGPNKAKHGTNLVSCAMRPEIAMWTTVRSRNLAPLQALSARWLGVTA